MKKRLAIIILTSITGLVVSFFAMSLTGFKNIIMNLLTGQYIVFGSLILVLLLQWLVKIIEK